MTKTKNNHFIIIILAIFIGILFLTHSLAAQEKVNKISTKNIEYADLKDSVENTLAIEKRKFKSARRSA